MQITCSSSLSWREVRRRNGSGAPHPGVFFFSAFDGGMWGEERSSPLSYPPPALGSGIHSSPDSHHSNSRHVTAQVSHSHYGNQCPPFPGLPWGFVTWSPPQPDNLWVSPLPLPCTRTRKTAAWIREVHVCVCVCWGGAFNYHGNKSTPPGDTSSCCYGNRRTSHGDIRPYSQGSEPYPERGERPPCFH